MKKILIFGGGGFVGGNLVVMAQQRGWQVAATARDPNDSVPGAMFYTCDVMHTSEVEAVLQQTRPDAVVNLVALADIDRAQRERALAWQVNALAAEQIAGICARTGLRHIFFSSDAVFDGYAAGYREEDPPNPLNYYGETKAAAEKMVLAAHDQAIVLRVSIILGFPLRKGNAFMAGLKQKLALGQQINTTSEEVRTPIDVITLCEAVLELAESDFTGILHLGSTDAIDRVALARGLAGLMGYPPEVVCPAAPSTGDGRARRHKNGILYVDKAQKVLSTPMRTIGETIVRSFESPGKI
jgi:dTDP-4-dehydrorhamnose reductase